MPDLAAIKKQAEADEWEVEESVRSVVCPVCAFTFDAQQWTLDADNPCPACNEIRLECQLAEAQGKLDAVEKAARQWGGPVGAGIARILKGEK